MNTHGEIAAIQRLRQGLAGVDISVSPVPTDECGQLIRCHYYNNPDGTLRWLWRTGAVSPDFLRFYHIGSWRGRPVTYIVRSLFGLRLSRLVSHSSGRTSAADSNATNYERFIHSYSC